MSGFRRFIMIVLLTVFATFTVQSPVFAGGYSEGDSINSSLQCKAVSYVLNDDDDDPVVGGCPGDDVEEDPVVS